MEEIMYGVPKFKENFFMKYKKEVILSVGAFLTIATVVRFSPSNDFANVKEIKTISYHIEKSEPVTGYKMIMNGSEIGVVSVDSDVESLINDAYAQLVAEIGYDPELSYEPALIPVKSNEEASVDTTILVTNLKNALLSSLDVIKTKAFVMRIGEDFTVILESEEAVKEVLAKAQENFIKTNIAVEINLDVNEHNTFVMTPRVLMKSSDPSVGLSTAPQDDEMDMLALSTGVTPTKEEAKEETKEEAKEEAEEDKEDGKMVAIEFAEDIAIVEAFVDPGQVVPVDEAVALITKENEEEKIYLVEEGDNPSQIAVDNGMKLSELYKMNPGLEEKQTKIRIGDPIIVMVPEPELKVETVVEIVYIESIAFGTSEVSNSDAYVGTSKVVSSGISGSQEVTALVKKLNGEEVEREIIATKVITQPVNKVVSKGTKPYPTKGATGNYIYPVSGYRISSPFGYRWGSLHTGVDLACSKGTSIVAIDGGTIVFAGWKSSTYGYFVEIDHGKGVTSRYAHLSKVLATVGQEIHQGEEIGLVGSTGRSTGPHLHLELRFDGSPVNPIKYLD
jgi:murein DD-endopeptidase MepM/ murein hydrolase activator NlpD